MFVYACPADGAKRVSSEAGRGAQSKTKSWISSHGGSDLGNAFIEMIAFF